VSIYSEPYKPKPILFIHGIDGNSKCWGVSPKYVDTTYNNKIYNIAKDSIIKDSIIDGRILPVCLEKLLPMVWNWDTLGYDTTYTIPGGVTGWPEDPSYPNKTFLEIINFNDNNGSIDKPGNYWPIADRYNSPTYCCQAEELSNRIRSVLGEYYGTGPSDTSRTATWVNDTTAKLILVAHSMGNTTIHQAMIWDSMLVHHIYKHISVDGVNAGTWVATPGAGDLVYAKYDNKDRGKKRAEISI
ncbi:hypothetical protein KAU15_03235, partial [candidate division WOR-3 bacterium]|nr:hypothetical protein [candidate division WOR-3 bacterium]